MSGTHFDHIATGERKLLSLELKELWHYRDLIALMTLRDFKIRFKQSFLGILWALLQPMITMLVFTLVFSKGLKVEVNGPYPLYILSGLVAWNYISKVMTGGTASIVNEADLVRKVYFPRLSLIFSQALAAFSDLMIAVTFLALLMLFYGSEPGIEILAFPLFLFWALILGSGGALWLSPINVRFRDIQIALPLLLQSLFMLSPIAWSLKPGRVAPWMESLFHLNPISGIVEGCRWACFSTGDPFRWEHLLSMALTAVFFLSGLAFFNLTQRKFADVI